MSGAQQKLGKQKAEMPQVRRAEDGVELGAASMERTPGGEFLTKRELAARLKVTVRTVENWHLKGLLPHFKIGQTVRFYWTDVVVRLTGTFARQASGAVRARWGASKENPETLKAEMLKRTTDNRPQTKGQMPRAVVGGASRTCNQGKGGGR